MKVCTGSTTCVCLFNMDGAYLWLTVLLQYSTPRLQAIATFSSSSLQERVDCFIAVEACHIVTLLLVYSYTWYNFAIFEIEKMLCMII